MAGLFDGTPLERPVTCACCGKALDACCCPRNASGQVSAPASQHPRVRREKRRGNWCTIIAGLDLAPDELKSLASELRTSLGTGGGLTEGDILIQGDHRDRVVEKLRAAGYQAKAAGG